MTSLKRQIHGCLKVSLQMSKFQFVLFPNGTNDFIKETNTWMPKSFFTDG